MAYDKLSPYTPQPAPTIDDSRQRWLEDELRKLELAIRALIAAIEELRAKVP